MKIVVYVDICRIQSEVKQSVVGWLVRFARDQVPNTGPSQLQPVKVLH